MLTADITQWLVVYNEYKRGPRTDLTKFQNTSIYWYLETECNHPNTIETIPMPYHQGVKVRYSDPQYQMPRKDQGAAKSLIFSDLRQLRYHYKNTDQSQCCEISCALIGNSKPTTRHGPTISSCIQCRKCGMYARNDRLMTSTETIFFVRQ